MVPNAEAALIARYRAGDTTAFDEIYDALNPRLFSFLCRMAKSRTVAEDLLEETWLRFVSSQHSLGADTRLVPWFFTVARNLFLSYCRSRAREEAYTSDLILLGPAEWPRSPYDSALYNQFEQRLEAALAKLPPAYREVLLLVGVEGFRPAGAAEICGISAEACRQRLSRARSLLSALLLDCGPSPETSLKEVTR